MIAYTEDDVEAAARAGAMVLGMNFDDVDEVDRAEALDYSRRVLAAVAPGIAAQAAGEALAPIGELVTGQYKVRASAIRATLADHAAAITAHNAKIRAEALRDAAGALPLGTPVWEKWLRARAEAVDIE